MSSILADWQEIPRVLFEVILLPSDGWNCLKLYSSFGSKIAMKAWNCNGILIVRLLLDLVS